MTLQQVLEQAGREVGASEQDIKEALFVTRAHHPGMLDREIPEHLVEPLRSRCITNLMVLGAEDCLQQIQHLNSLQ